MVKIKEGDLLCSTEDIIIHQVNCQGIMGSGVALAIKIKYPKVFKYYYKLCKSVQPETLMGSYQTIQVSKNKKIINMFTQLNYGYNGERFTDYIHFTLCFSHILSEYNNKENNNIAIPYKIGCCRGGADWDSILKYIEMVAQDYSGNIVIYKI